MQENEEDQLLFSVTACYYFIVYFVVVHFVAVVYDYYAAKLLLQQLHVHQQLHAIMMFVVE